MLVPRQEYSRELKVAVGSKLKCPLLVASEMSGSS